MEWFLDQKRQVRTYTKYEIRNRLVCLFVCLFYSYIRPALTWRHAEIYLQWIFNSSVCETIANMFWFRFKSRFNDFDSSVSFMFINCYEVSFSNHCYVFELFDFSNVWIKNFSNCLFFRLILILNLFVICFFRIFWLLFVLFEFVKLLFFIMIMLSFVVWSLKLLYVWWFTHFWKCSVFNYQSFSINVSFSKSTSLSSFD